MNPISQARHLSTMSSTKLAKELKVSKQYISRIEQGLYDKPNPKIMNWAAETLDRNRNRDSNPYPITTAVVEQLYREWQWQQRESVKQSKLLRPIAVTKYDRISQAAARGGNTIDFRYYPIFGQWVGSYWDSAHSFCVQMCLHPSPVGNYIDGGMYAMPAQLTEVLTKLDLIGEGFKVNEY